MTNGGELIIHNLSTLARLDLSGIPEHVSVFLLSVPSPPIIHPPQRTKNPIISLSWLSRTDLSDLIDLADVSVQR